MRTYLTGSCDILHSQNARNAECGESFSMCKNGAGYFSLSRKDHMHGLTWAPDIQRFSGKVLYVGLHCQSYNFPP